jgi:hypothetical protein
MKDKWVQPCLQSWEIGGAKYQVILTSGFAFLAGSKPLQCLSFLQMICLVFAE